MYWVLVVCFLMDGVIAVIPSLHLDETQTLHSVISNIEKRLDSKLKVLREDLSQAQTTIAELHHELNTVKSAYAELSENCHHLLSTSSDKDVLTAMSTGESTFIGVDNPAAISVQNKKKRDEEPILNRQKKVSGSYTSRVIFQAYMSENLVNVHPGQKIIYHHSHLDVGGDYDTNSGIFTCPQTGWYVFHLTIVTYPNKRAELFLKKNDGTFGLAYSGSANYFSSGSTMGIVHCDVGDRVWVEADATNDSGMLLPPKWNFFSGFLLYPDEM